MAQNLRATYEQRVNLENPNVGNKVPSLQRVYQVADGLPVFLKGKHDARVYRGIMVFSVIGIGISFFSIYQMAAGTMKKKGT